MLVFELERLKKKNRVEIYIFNKKNETVNL